MTNQTRSAVHNAATKAETLAYNLANASSHASVLSEVLDKELGSTIEGQSFAAPITLLDKLKEDGEGLERRAVRLHRDMHGRVANKAPSAGAGTYEGGRGMAQIQVTEEYKKAVEAYEVAFGEKPPYCVKDPEYIMECVRRGEPSDLVPDPNACY